VVSAQQQLRRTEVRAPFDGVVSERKASVGDTAQVGKELLKVVDPRSMRFEGLVSADRMGEIKLGQAAKFRINGVEGVEFAGKVQRLDASANAVTRQVEVLVSFDDAAKAPRETSIVRSGEAAHVWRVGKDGTLAKAAVQLGERDARSGEVVLKGGLADGDVILRKPGSTLVDGQKVEFVKAAASGVAK
jgi:membrane fusion protein (multidrug efflux system)